MIYLNGDQVNVTLFPDNTSQVWKLDEKHFNQERADIRWEFSHEGEIMQIAQLRQLLGRTVDRIYLTIDYLPYGRQDKSVSNDATFALHTFSTIINNLNFAKITLLDPHSRIASCLIKKSFAIYPHDALGAAIRVTQSNLLCYPDNGALTKYTGIYNFPNYIYGEKVRDQATGYISNYKLVGDCTNKRVLIVDDICDGGKTFEILTNDLTDNGAEDVSLFVTHGLFSKGLRPLLNAGIYKIFTNKGEAILMPDGGFGFRKVKETPYEIDNSKFKPYNGYCWTDQEDYATKARLYYGDDQY